MKSQVVVSPFARYVNNVGRIRGHVIRFFKNVITDKCTERAGQMFCRFFQKLKRKRNQ